MTGVTLTDRNRRNTIPFTDILGMATVDKVHFFLLRKFINFSKIPCGLFVAIFSFH